MRAVLRNTVPQERTRPGLAAVLGRALVVGVLVLPGCGGENPLVGSYAADLWGLSSINVDVPGRYTLDLDANGRFVLGIDGSIWTKGTYIVMGDRVRIRSDTPTSECLGSSMYSWKFYDRRRLRFESLDLECNDLARTITGFFWERD